MRISDIDKAFRSRVTWFDLTLDEQIAFAQAVKRDDVQGWDGLQDKAIEYGFTATEDMPSGYELRLLADDHI